MYRFVSTILDEDAQIREHANFCLKNVLLPLMPFMFSAHFVECLLYFNDIPKPFKGRSYLQIHLFEPNFRETLYEVNYTATRTPIKASEKGTSY